MSVTVKNNDINFALSKFKREVARKGTLAKAREIANGYRKPGVKNREEKKVNTMNSRKNNKNKY